MVAQSSTILHPPHIYTLASGNSSSIDRTMSARALGYRSVATSSTSQLLAPDGSNLEREGELSGLQSLPRRVEGQPVRGRIHVFPCALLQSMNLVAGTLYLTGDFALLQMRPRPYSLVRMRVNWLDVLAIQERRIMGQSGIRLVTAVKTLDLCNLTEPVQARSLMISLWQSQVKRLLLQPPPLLDDPEIWQVQRRRRPPKAITGATEQRDPSPVPPEARLSCGCLAHLEDEIVSTIAVGVPPISLARMLVLAEEPSNMTNLGASQLPVLIATGPWHPDPHDGRPCRSMIHQLPTFFGGHQRVTASCLVRIERETADHVVLLMIGRSPEMLYGRDFALHLRWCFSRHHGLAGRQTRLTISMRIVPTGSAHPPLLLIRKRAVTACSQWFETLIALTQVKLQNKIEPALLPPYEPSLTSILEQLYFFGLRPNLELIEAQIQKQVISLGLFILAFSLAQRWWSQQPWLMPIIDFS